MELDADKRPDVETLMKEFSFFDTAPDFKDSWYEEYEQRMEKYKKVENDPYFNKEEAIWT